MCMCTDREEDRRIAERGEDMLYVVKSKSVPPNWGLIIKIIVYRVR